MDVILHLGAHRCASTTFQSYVRDQIDALGHYGTHFWGPFRTRRGLFEGLFPATGVMNAKKAQQRAEGRVKLQLARLRREGVQQLLVSEENLIGTCRHSLKARKLYPAIGERMARIGSAFDGQITRVVLVIRGHDLWWSSAMAYAVGRGHNVPGPEAVQKIADSTRGWQDVITDLACALPEAEIIIIPFERAMGRPDHFLSVATGFDAPPDDSTRWLNKRPEIARLRALLHERGSDPDQLPDEPAGRWQPFDAPQLAQLQERYLDDLFWLEAGANGLATYINSPQGSGQSLASGDLRRGNGYEIGQDQQRHLAGSG